jgi:ParB-like chromosome segregation protein Spo0J
VPIIIAKRDDVAVVVDGRHRVRAARIVNRRRKARGEAPLSIECKIVRGTESSLAETSSLANAVRFDDDVETQIEKLKRHMDRGLSLDHCARMLGKSVVTLKGWLAYEDGAVVEVKKAVEGGRLSQSAASHIAKLAPDEQRKALDAALSLPAGAKLTRKAAKTAAKRASKPESNSIETLSIRETRKLLTAVSEKKHPSNTSEKTFAFWQGVESALSLVVGEGDGVDERLKTVLDGIRAEAKS